MKKIFLVLFFIIVGCSENKSKFDINKVPSYPVLPIANADWDKIYNQCNKAIDLQYILHDLEIKKDITYHIIQKSPVSNFFNQPVIYVSVRDGNLYYDNSHDDVEQFCKRYISQYKLDNIYLTHDIYRVRYAIDGQIFTRYTLEIEGPNHIFQDIETGNIITLTTQVEITRLNSIIEPESAAKILKIEILMNKRNDEINKWYTELPTKFHNEYTIRKYNPPIIGNYETKMYFIPNRRYANRRVEE